MSSFPVRRASDNAGLANYVASLGQDAAEAGASLGEPTWDDDGWAGKLDVLLADPPAIVSFTFGCPPADTITAFHAAGALVAVTVTSPEEAGQAVRAGADCLCVQGIEAGAHQGTFGNDPASGEGSALLPLLAAVARVTDLPKIGTGGIMTAQAVAEVLAAGAVAAQCGTAFLRSPESGAHLAHKAALADERFTGTALTRAFSGRPARGLVNGFMRDHAGAPAAYPEINNVTRPLRAQASRQGDLDRMSLYAGTGFRAATTLPAPQIVANLTP